MNVKQFDIWVADLNPTRGTKPGKVRPVVVVQTNFLNNLHPSTIICPVTTSVLPDSEILRVHLKKGQTEELSDILVDQIRTIDNKRMIKKIGELSGEQIQRLKDNLKIVLDLS